MSDSKREVRRALQAQTKPFCIVDLISRLEQKGFTDRSIILSELDELYDEGVVGYDRITTHTDGKEVYAFFIKQ